MRCLIRLTSTTVAGSSDTLETLTRGMFRPMECVDERRFRIDFRSSDDGNPDHVIATTVTVSASEAVIIRKGGGSSTMTIVPGETHPCLYETGFGSLELEVVGKSIRLTEIDSEHFVAELSYDILSGGVLACSNEIRLAIEPLGTP